MYIDTRDIIPLMYDIRKNNMLHIIACCWKFGKSPLQLNMLELQIDTGSKNAQTEIEILDYLANQNTAFNKRLYFYERYEKVDSFGISGDSMLNFVIKNFTNKKAKGKPYSLKKSFIDDCKTMMKIATQSQQQYHEML